MLKNVKILLLKCCTLTSFIKKKNTLRILSAEVKDFLIHYSWVRQEKDHKKTLFQ